MDYEASVSKIAFEKPIIIQLRWGKLEKVKTVYFVVSKCLQCFSKFNNIKGKHLFNNQMKITALILIYDTNNGFIAHWEKLTYILLLLYLRRK